LGRNGFHPLLVTWDQHPERDAAWASAERSRIGEERFRREHQCITGDSVVTIKMPDGKIRKVTLLELEQIMR